MLRMVLWLQRLQVLCGAGLELSLSTMPVPVLLSRGYLSCCTALFRLAYDWRSAIRYTNGQEENRHVCLVCLYGYSDDIRTLLIVQTGSWFSL